MNRRLRFVVGAALLVGAPGCSDESEPPPTCNPCEAGIDAGDAGDVQDTGDGSDGGE